MHIVLVDNGRSERLGMDPVLVVAEVHPLRGVHEHLPGVPPQRGPELRGNLRRADRRDFGSDLQRPEV